MTPEQAGSIISLTYFFVIPGMPALASLSDFLRTRRKIIIISSAIAIIDTTVLALLGPKITYPLLLGQGVLFGLTAGLAGTLAFTALRETLPLRFIGTGIGILQTLPYLLVAPLAQKLVGLVLESRIANGASEPEAYSIAMLVNVVFLIIGFIAAYFVKESFGKGEPA